MKIGIDIFSFDRPGENFGVGPGVYVWNLLPKLFEYGKDMQFYVFGNKENESLIPKADNVKIIKSKGTWKYLGFEDQLSFFTFLKIEQKEE